jgi:hypothetical protein
MGSLHYQIDVDGDGRQDHMIRVTLTALQLCADNYFHSAQFRCQPFVLQWELDTDTQLFVIMMATEKPILWRACRRRANDLVYLESSTQQGRAVTFGTTGDQRLPNRKASLLAAMMFLNFRLTLNFRNVRY